MQHYRPPQHAHRHDVKLIPGFSSLNLCEPLGIFRMVFNGLVLWHKVLTVVGGPHSTMDRVLASHPAAPGSIPGGPRLINGAAA